MSSLQIDNVVSMTSSMGTEMEDLTAPLPMGEYIIPRQRRQPNFSSDENLCLIRGWREHCSEFDGIKQNKIVYKKIVKRLQQSGFNRTIREVRSKINNLKTKYKAELKKAAMESTTPDWEYHHQVHEIMTRQHLARGVAQSGDNIKQGLTEDQKHQPQVDNLVSQVISDSDSNDSSAAYTTSNERPTLVMADISSARRPPPTMVNASVVQVPKPKRRKVDGFLRQVIDQHTQLLMQQKDMMELMKQTTEHELELIRRQIEIQTQLIVQQANLMTFITSESSD